MKRIVLGVTGSIAAFKAADIASRLVKAGHQVNVVMTTDAQAFITPLTLQTLSKQPVVTGFYDEKQAWCPGHIELADAADLMLIAPATAHCLAQLAQGLAQDTLTAVALATRASMLIAPAMNGNMWLHPATQRNVATLQEWQVDFEGPDPHGMLACGYEGVGRLAPVEAIVARVETILSENRGKRRL